MMRRRKKKRKGKGEKAAAMNQQHLILGNNLHKLMRKPTWLMHGSSVVLHHLSFHNCCNKSDVDTHLLFMIIAFLETPYSLLIHIWHTYTNAYLWRAMLSSSNWLLLVHKKILRYQHYLSEMLTVIGIEYKAIQYHKPCCYSIV